MVSTPRTPEQFRAGEVDEPEFHVSEIAADKAGAVSPFGPDIEFPMPLDRIRYRHPSRADRPNLADGR